MFAMDLLRNVGSAANRQDAARANTRFRFRTILMDTKPLSLLLERIFQRQLHLSHGLGRCDQTKSLWGKHARRGRIPIRVIGEIKRFGAKLNAMMLSDPKSLAP